MNGPHVQAIHAMFNAIQAAMMAAEEADPRLDLTDLAYQIDGAHHVFAVTTVAAEEAGA